MPPTIAEELHRCRTCTWAAWARRRWGPRRHTPRLEILAYACEAFARILDRTPRAAQGVAEAAAFGLDPTCPGGSVDPAEPADILCQAARSRNGCRVILHRCAR